MACRVCEVEHLPSVACRPVDLAKARERKLNERVVKQEAHQPSKAKAREVVATKTTDEAGSCVVPVTASETAFDRVTYQKEYMRKWRARKAKR